MKAKTAAIQSRNAGRTEVNVEDQVLGVGFASLGVLSCAVGTWSLFSLAGGMAVSGGPLALVADWLKAILG